jgi:hypothetical protein
MTAGSIVLFTFLVVFAYLIAPGSLWWGWARWVKQTPRSWKITSIFSFIGFVFATASALFAIWIWFFAASGGFGTITPNYAPDYDLFGRCIRWGALLSTAGIAFAIGGVRRASSIRWQSLASAIGTLAFWLLATAWQ